MSLRRFSLVSALAWMLLLFYLSDQPVLPTPTLFPGQDKVFHAVFYAVLGFLLLGAHHAGTAGYRRSQVRSSVLIASLYGISDEIHQFFVPGRTADVLDWVADTLGALLAALLFVWVRRQRKASEAVSR